MYLRCQGKSVLEQLACVDASPQNHIIVRCRYKVHYIYLLFEHICLFKTYALASPQYYSLLHTELEWYKLADALFPLPF